MSVPIDETDFIDRDLQASQKASANTVAVLTPPDGIAARPPTREELEAKVGEAQNRIADLKRAQLELERERAALEESRRRRHEFETGRAEMRQHLTRGIGLLEKAEFQARRDAEQMARTLAGFKEALANVERIREEGWTQETWQSELTQALTTIENARMEWNAARLKWTLLGDNATQPAADGEQDQSSGLGLDRLGFWRLCALGLALTWPLALAVLVLIGILVSRGYGR